MTKMKDMRSTPFDVGLPRIVRRPTRIVQTIPTGNIRHLPAIRSGKINYAEVFSKQALAQIPVDPDVEREIKAGRGKEVVIDAAEKVREGRKESQAQNAKKVRKQTRKKHILRESKQTRPGKDTTGKGKQHVQKGSTSKKQSKNQNVGKPPKVKAQDKTPQKPKVKKFVKRQVKKDGEK